MAACVVVWEWQNEYGSWRPYSPQISAFLEANKNSPSAVHLGSVDSKLYLYKVDFQQMCQFRHGTGTQRAVRRSVLPSSSPLAKGITWQWEGDALGTWCDFDIDIINYLDECYHRGDQFIDLSKSKFFLPYHIDLKSMTQKRVQTGRVRNIQRVFTSTSYPRDFSSAQTSATKHSLGASHISSDVPKRLRGTNTSVNNLNMPVQSVTTINSASFTSGAGLFGTTQPKVNTTSSVTLPQGLGLFGGCSPVLFSSSVSPSNSHGSGRHASHHGPMTRRMHSQSFSSQTPTGGVSSPVVTTSAFAPVHSQNPTVSHSGFHSGQTSRSVYLQPGHYQPANHVSLSVGHGNVPVIGGFPGTQPAGSGSSGLPQPSLLQGGLNPTHLFGGAQLKVRPSQGASSSQTSGFASSSSVHIQPYERIPNCVSKSSRKNRKASSAAEDILHSYVEILDSPPADDDCCICYEKLVEASGHGSGTPEDQIVYKLGKCSHMFHKLCLIAMYESGAKDGHVQCPSCKTIYGEKMGNCPKGEMEYKIIDHELPGYEGHKTIQIMYLIHSGTQGPEHPSPGKRYSARGFPRVGYLPDCDKGRMVLQLLIVAWKRRLTFTISRSTTTGEENTVTWNEIHHKTELGTNYSGHGFPDPKYLDNVLQELSVHGITEKDLPSG